MNQTENAPDEAAIRAQQIKDRFDEQEREFVAKEEQLANYRAWFAKHHDLIAPFTWRVSFVGNEITFFKHANSDQHPKAIAIAFGKEGWTRKKDGYTCGSLHWVKEFDGILLEINEAEYIDLKPREQVRL